MAAPAIPLVLEMHAEDAAILWLQRNRAVDAPHFNPMLLGRLEERLEAHVDGLRVAGDAGWEVARAAVERYPEPGEVFAAAVLALEGRQAGRVEAVLAVVEAGAEGAARGFVSAMGWVGARHLGGTVAGLMEDGRAGRRALGVAACSVHRVDPGGRLAGLLADEAPVRAPALRLAGELGRADAAGVAVAGVGEAEPVGFRAAWAAGLLGERRAAVPALQREVEAAGAHRQEALQLVLRIMERGAAMGWLRELGRLPARARVLVEGAGVLGDPGLVPWLIGCMADSALARVAGESFAMITGADLGLEDLDGEAPPGASFGPNDDPADPNVALDSDEDLAWPDPARVEAWWAARAGGFRDGGRYLVGREPTEAALGEIFRSGFQRQRRAAALELAVRKPGAPLLNWRAPVVARGG